MYLLNVRGLGAGGGYWVGEVGSENLLKVGLTLLQELPGMLIPRGREGGRKGEGGRK